MEKLQWNSVNEKQNRRKQSKNEKSSSLPRNPTMTSVDTWEGN